MKQLFIFLEGQIYIYFPNLPNLFKNLYQSGKAKFFSFTSLL
jgi:hypothetical protein